mgnify:FL=1
MIALEMGQAEVIEYFEKHPDKWHTSLEIRRQIGGTQSSVTAALKKLRMLDLVEYREIRNPQKMYLYKSKK